MRNNLSHDSSPLKATNTIYEYKCTTGECELQPQVKYIGMSTTTLSRRLTMHLGSGGPRKHMEQAHRTRITREDLVNNTRIVTRIDHFSRLEITEAILIQKESPSINGQDTGRVRKLRLLGDGATPPRPPAV